MFTKFSTFVIKPHHLINKNNNKKSLDLKLISNNKIISNLLMSRCFGISSIQHQIHKFPFISQASLALTQERQRKDKIDILKVSRIHLQRYSEVSKPIQKIPKIYTAESKVKVDWQDNQTSKFHNLWLRDHCKCSKCYHQITKQRLLDTFSIPEDIKPLSISPGSSGVEIIWSGNDEHKSFFNWNWLRRHSYDPKFINSQQILNNKKTLWNAAKIKDNLPIVQYHKVMQNKEDLAIWLKNIDEFGFCFIDNVPPKVKETEELAKRICFIRESHYGKFWDFTANMEHGDTAYSTLALKAHTDNTYFTDPSGLQMFHLIEFEGEGGESLLADGFWMANQLKTKYPKAYQTLSTIPIPSHSAGDSNVLIQPTPFAYPIFNHDSLTNTLYQIRYNNDDRSTMSHLSPNQIPEFYDALRKWNELLSNKENEFWFQLYPGRVLIFDNWRILHGRASFVGHRRLIGAYLNWDDYRSKFKVLNLSNEEILESL
ncbi:hypothetical protein Glove_669g14 [Diversispora epigaea]|uniref:trimethyllysine dioxygenase n=1 Tax=Diversispora epigaea TaxID=1348612 RepID=A0A397G3H6_9GLOM|nr:hypothetical protein Glove_669g14 [Diversispora epigaea]